MKLYNAAQIVSLEKVEPTKVRNYSYLKIMENGKYREVIERRTFFTELNKEWSLEDYFKEHPNYYINDNQVFSKPYIEVTFSNNESKRIWFEPDEEYAIFSDFIKLQKAVFKESLIEL